MPKKLVLILPDECRAPAASTGVEDGSSSASLVSGCLANPRDGVEALYLFSGDKTRVYEVNKLTEPFQTWLHRGEVIPGGDLHVVTAVDPLFLVLPYLAKNTKFFAPIDQTVKDQDCPAASWLVSCVRPEQLERICDSKKAGGHEAYRYNEGKTLAWLEAKARRLSEGLKAKGMLGGRSSNYVQGSRNNGSDSSDEEERYLAESVGILCDYLEPRLAIELKKHLGVAVDPVASVNLQDDENLEPCNKKPKICEPDEDYSLGYKVQKAAKETKKSVTQRKLAVAAKGTKSIASFFGKPKAK